MKRIIDFHAHYYPDEVRRAPSAFADRHDEKFWGDLVAPKNGKSIQGWASMEEMLENMDRCGIVKSVLLGWYWEHPKVCEMQIDWYEDVVSAHPDRLEAFVPWAPGGSLTVKEFVVRAKDRGFIGIGELHPGAQGYGFKDEELMELLSHAQESRLIVNFHVTEPVGRPQSPQVGVDARDIQEIVEKFPHLKIVLSHWGGLLCFHEHNPYIRTRWKNVYYDSAASPLLYGDQVVADSINVAGAQKCLFGTDYPLRVFPKSAPGEGVSQWLEGLSKLELGEAEEDFYYQNAINLIESAK